MCFAFFMDFFNMKKISQSNLDLAKISPKYKEYLKQKILSDFSPKIIKHGDDYLLQVFYNGSWYYWNEDIKYLKRTGGTPNKSFYIDRHAFIPFRIKKLEEDGLQNSISLEMESIIQDALIFFYGELFTDDFEESHIFDYKKIKELKNKHLDDIYQKMVDLDLDTDFEEIERLMKEKQLAKNN